METLKNGINFPSMTFHEEHAYKYVSLLMWCCHDGLMMRRAC